MPCKDIYVVLNQPMQLGECPLWDSKEGALYWIDILDKKVHCFNEVNQSYRYWRMPSEPGCIVKHIDGNLLVALRTGLMYLNLTTDKMTVLCKAPYNIHNTRFNDGRCDSKGRLWVGTIYEPRDLQYGSIFCFEKGVLYDKQHHVVTSNGIAFNVTQTRMYHADTAAHCINVYDFDCCTGKTSNMRLFKQFVSNKKALTYIGRPDGAAVDSHDTYWCAMFEGGRILQFSSCGKILQEISLPVCCPTMVCFGGQDLKTLYITSARFGRSKSELETYPLSGYILAIRINIKGQNEYVYKD